jgi:hypothetical protein
VNKRAFKAQEAQRKIVSRELEEYLHALCHDYQYAIRRACTLISILALPHRLTKHEQRKRLTELLAARREAQGWGRPWTEHMVFRVYYLKGRGFERVMPKPVTRKEMETYSPAVPESLRKWKANMGKAPKRKAQKAPKSVPAS